MSSRRFIFGTFSVIFQLALISGIIWVSWHRQDLTDWWRINHYRPSVEMQNIIGRAGIINRGHDLLYASQAEVDDRLAFNQACSSNSERSIVLGCYRNQHIYIYDVLDSRLNGVKEVTAAHEMLHAAYERLSSAERQHVNAMLEPIIKNTTDEHILALIQLYNAQEPGELYNEMHSVLGTEYRNLSPELEQYYSRYFTDRKKVVGYSEGYEAIFSASKTRIAADDQQLDQLKTSIEANNSELELQQGEIAATVKQLSELRAANNIEAYNWNVPLYNDKVHQFNALVTATRTLVDRYNALVEQRNQEAAVQNTLYQSLDSHYQALPQN